MQLNITTDYAIRILLYLASKDGVTDSNELCDTLKISHEYIYTIGRKLKQAGLVSTKSGYMGGYVLQRDPSEISLYDVLDLFESTIKVNRCLQDDSYCTMKGAPDCVIHKSFAKLQRSIEEHFRKETIYSLLLAQKERV